MIRMSTLPVSQFCGGVSRLPSASGRAAAMSTAFHALCHDQEQGQAMLERLTAEEREDVLRWHKPTVAQYSGILLKYEEAVTELEVTLNARGRPAGPGEDASIGHLDMAWHKPWLAGSAQASGEASSPHPSTIAFVADIKRSRFTVEDGPESLQLLAYGVAYAQMVGAQYFACGIWSAMDGEWEWGKVRSMATMEMASLISRILAAAKNDTGEYSTGSHCRRCWARFGCPAHNQRGLEGTQLDVGNLSAETAGEILLKLQAAEDAVGKSLETVKDWARVNGPIRAGEREFGLVGKQMRWSKAKTRA